MKSFLAVIRLGVWNMERKNKQIWILLGILIIGMFAFSTWWIMKGRDIWNARMEENETDDYSDLYNITDSSKYPGMENDNEFENYPDVKATFHITIPEPIPDGYYITIGCNLNDWYPLDTTWKVKKVDDTHYQCEMDLKESYFWYRTDLDSVMKDGELKIGLQYKWTLQREGLEYENMWSMVEISQTSHDIQNRVVILKEGENVFYDEVGRFKGEEEVLNNEPTVVGKLVYETVKSDGLLQDDYRMLRVWLPEGYDANDTSKRYPVLYMHDGQNLFDEITSFAGEWNIDETITGCMQNGYEGCIVVGIDSDDETRMAELSPTFTEETGDGENYARYIVEKVKPFIDGKYNTKPEREYTGIGGSSMGGAMSYFMCMEYPEVFGKGICFSPALVYYTDEDLIHYMEEKQFDKAENLPKICIYSGGVGIGSGLGNDERSLTRYVEFLQTNMIELGYPAENIYAFTDEMGEHSEAAWSKYFPTAFKWLEGLE